MATLRGTSQADSVLSVSRQRSCVLRLLQRSPPGLSASPSCLLCFASKERALSLGISGGSRQAANQDITGCPWRRPLCGFSGAFVWLPQQGRGCTGFLVVGSKPDNAENSEVLSFRAKLQPVHKPANYLSPKSRVAQRWGGREGGRRPSSALPCSVL